MGVRGQALVGMREQTKPNVGFNSLFPTSRSKETCCAPHGWGREGGGFPSCPESSSTTTPGDLPPLEKTEFLQVWHLIKRLFHL